MGAPIVVRVVVPKAIRGLGEFTSAVEILAAVLQDLLQLLEIIAGLPQFAPRATPLLVEVVGDISADEVISVGIRCGLSGIALLLGRLEGLIDPHGLVYPDCSLEVARLRIAELGLEVAGQDSGGSMLINTALPLLFGAIHITAVERLPDDLELKLRQLAFLHLRSILLFSDTKDAVAAAAGILVPFVFLVAVQR